MYSSRLYRILLYLVIVVGLPLLYVFLWSQNNSPFDDPPRPAGNTNEQAEALNRLWVDGNLTEVFMLTPYLGWASGSITSDPKTGKSYAVLLRYTDGKWENVTGPELADYGFIGSVHMFSSISGYALGVGQKYKEDYDGNGWAGHDDVLLRYNKDRWEEARRFPGEAKYNRHTRKAAPWHRLVNLLDLDVVSPQEAYIISSQASYGTGQVSHGGDYIHKVSLTSDEWVGQEITGRPGPREMAMVSSKEGWAAGGYQSLYRYDGSQWQYNKFLEVPREGRTPALVTDFSIKDIQMLSATEGWGIGWVSEKDRTGAEEYVPVHYKDRVWRMEKPALGWNLRDLYMISSNEGWAIASPSNDAEEDVYEQAILHYANGEWKKEKMDSMTKKLNQLYMVSTDEGWAVGSHGVIMHYQNGNWSIYRP